MSEFLNDLKHFRMCWQRFGHHKCYTKEIHEMICIICVVSFCILPEMQNCVKNCRVCEEIPKCMKKYKSVWRNTKVCEKIQKCVKKYKVWATSTMSLGIPRHSLSHTLMPSAFPYLVCILTTSSPKSSSSSPLPFFVVKLFLIILVQNIRDN